MKLQKFRILFSMQRFSFEQNIGHATYKKENNIETVRKYIVS